MPAAASVEQGFDLFQTAAVARRARRRRGGGLRRGVVAPPGVEFVGRLARGGGELRHRFQLIFRNRAEGPLLDCGAKGGGVHPRGLGRVDDAAGFQPRTEQRRLFQDAFERDRHGTPAAVAGGDGHGAAFAVGRSGGAPAVAAEDVAPGFEREELAVAADDFVAGHGVVAEAEGADHGGAVQIGGQARADGGGEHHAESGGTGETERGHFDDEGALLRFEFDILFVPGAPDDFEFFRGLRRDAALGVPERGDDGVEAAGGGVFRRLNDDVVELVLVHDDPLLRVPRLNEWVSDCKRAAAFAAIP